MTAKILNLLKVYNLFAFVYVLPCVPGVGSDTCICRCINAYIFVWVIINVYTCDCYCLHLCECANINVCVNACICMYVRICINTCFWACVYMFDCLCIWACVNVCICVCVLIHAFVHVQGLIKKKYHYWCYGNWTKVQWVKPLGTDRLWTLSCMHTNNVLTHPNCL